MEEKRFTLRMDGELFEEISHYAEIHRRSAAKEIEYAVAKYIKELKRDEILNMYDKETTSIEETKEMLQELKKVNEKYGFFENK